MCSPTFFKIYRAKSVQEFKPDPYIATILNCCMWVFYGLPFVHPDSILVVTINAIGFLIEIFYICIFFAYSDWPKRRKILIALLIEVVFVVVVIFITMTFLHTTKRRSMLVGILCVVFNIIMYNSPLTVMIPNGLGALSGAVQLILYATYYKSTKWDDQPNPPPSELQLSSKDTPPNP
ncbi:hypothetical protein Vadar_023305 [Vaccinium darrowii]|uniref:Uncharacterized protein n=1 Tax=Vaccinium darrowii TaxID=229202 RepID=A0ACB7ZKY0_9ERIC|nr:hypothetical protein Vadar_023305 [Vaccinium darrowii]